MADIQISDLTSSTITNDSDVFMFDNSEGVTYKLSYADLARAVLQRSISAGSNISITNDATVEYFKLIISSTASGSIWYYGTTQPASPNNGDYWINTTSGNNLEVYQYTNSQWISTGMQLKGTQGSDGTTPHIDSTSKHWIIGTDDTGVVAEGQHGTNGITPHIDNTTKHWVIGETDTGIVAEGQNGSNGNDGTSATIGLGTVSTGEAGTNVIINNSGTSSAAVFDFTIPRGADGTNGANGTNGYSVSATSSAITGGHRITISSTDPEASEETFDVMDGIEVIQTTSDDRTATLLAENWVGAFPPYTQAVAVTGMTSSVIPIIGLVPSDTLEDAMEEIKQWGYINEAESGTNTLTFTCYKDKPAIDLSVNIKVV